MKVGDLVRFDHINGHTGHLNGRVALYLGQHSRMDDLIGYVVVREHRVLMLGGHKIIEIAKGLVQYMRVINESR